MINNVVLVGRMTRDAELRHTPQNQPVASFNLAVNRNFKNGNGDREADFINCVIWGSKAENLTNWAKKGALIGITGRIQTRNYENQQGQTLTTNKGEGQKIVIPVLTPDRTDKRQNGRRFKSDGEPMFTLTAQDKHGILIAGKLPGNHDQNSRVYDTDGLAPTLSTMQGGGQEPKIIQRGHGYNQGGEHKIAPTLTSNSYHENNHLSDGFRIRKLTPRECWRLQGFPDWAFDKAQAVNSNSQLYKQAGNSVTVNVIEAIARELG